MKEGGLKIRRVCFCSQTMLVMLASEVIELRSAKNPSRNNFNPSVELGRFSKVCIQ